MKHYIKKLQTKPDHIKKQILVVSTVVLCGIVLSFWVFTLKYRFSSDENKTSLQSDLKPFGMLKEGVSKTYQDLSASVGAVNLNNFK